ncbi:MAG: formylmethanofuran dehydrogenase subunit E family protein [Methanocorpusculum sp.]|uniref:formylmethanofuran dehydrogenase subunit E family protein n=1 Tax=Methanocorpusculum sp. TaxID=2058474 RepID=UPI00271BCACA|nr:formylmethanofuran dehydrogenase subunit E family protein [Methanocorpusculum sp.]MDO9522180.1 formylmethanofuran dehydrogenase subunit E family protein [Methanocorpusculum sp.]
MTDIPDFDMIAKAHGHTCPGIALGYKIAVVAAKWSGTETNIKVLSHSTRCPLDALKQTFDLRTHPERLIVEDTNTVSFVLEKPDGSKLFIDEIPGTKVTSDELHTLKGKISAKTATEEEIKRHTEIQNELLQVMLNTPDEKLFTIREE